jgi:hypothetical protein
MPSPMEPLRQALAHVGADPVRWDRVCTPFVDEPPLREGDLPGDVVAALVSGGVVEVVDGTLE